MEPAWVELAERGFAVEGELGRGGAGVVLRARTAAGARVALKLARQDVPLASAQLVREAEALAAVGPPHAPRLFDAGVLGSGARWLAMELLDQPALVTLAARLAEVRGAMPEAELRARGAALVDAVAAVHQAGFAHGDLKPANVFSAASPGRAALIDFGLAVRLGGEDAGVAPAGAAAGTAEYLSPEQCAGTAVASARTDVYAVGAMLYELLVGQPPFTGDGAEVRQAQVARRVVRAPELGRMGAAVEEVVLACLAKEPEKRPANGGELSRRLAEVAWGRSVAVEKRPPATATASAGAGAGAASKGSRKAVCGVFVDGVVDARGLQAAVAATGGQLAHAAGAKGVVVYDHESSDNPARRALRAARGLVERRLCRRALVDVVTVTAQRRAAGPARYVSALFARDDRYPRPDDPAGVLVSAAAFELVSDLDATAVRDGVVRPVESAAHEAATVMQGSVDLLVGRDALLGQLVGAARVALARRAPTVATVLGERGLGKSRLAVELAQRLLRACPGVEVIDLRGREVIPGDPEETLARLVVRAFALDGAAPAADQRRALEGALPAGDRELWPALAVVLGLLPHDAPELRALAVAPGVLRTVLPRLVGDALRRRARERPLCVVLDDAHLADATTLDALEYAALSSVELPLFACALGRPALTAARPTWGERAARHELAELRPLEQEDAIALCRHLLHPAEAVPRDALERLAARAHGVPFLLVELIRGIKRDGLVRPSSRGDTFYLATDELERLPDLPLVEWLAERELSVLPAELAAHARLAALLGPEFRVAEMEGVVAELEREHGAAELPLDARVAVDRMRASGLLVTHRDEALGFAQSLVRDAVGRALPEAERRRIHRAAYDYYVAAPAMTETHRMPRLAHHAAAAGLHAEAAATYLTLAGRARREHRYLDAELLYSRALELLPPESGRDQLDARRGRGMMRYRVGRYDDSLRDFAEARRLADASGDRPASVAILLEHAMALDWINDYPGARALTDEARRLAGGVADPAVEAQLRMSLGRALFRDCRRVEACVELEAAAALAATAGDDGYETLVISLLLLQAILPDVGRLDDAAAVSERAIALARERSDRLHLGSALNMRRNLWVARKDVAAALDDQRSFMQIGTELGMVGWTYFAEYNLGELLYQHGDLDEAEPHVCRAMAIERRHREVAPRPVAALLWARLLAYRGEEPEAQAVVRRIRAAASGDLFAPSEEVLLTLVELFTRDASPAEWDALCARAREFSVEQEIIEVFELRGMAAARRGRRDEARRAYDEARRLAATLPNLIEIRMSARIAELDAAVDERLSA